MYVYSAEKAVRSVALSPPNLVTQYAYRMFELGRANLTGVLPEHTVASSPPNAAQLIFIVIPQAANDIFCREGQQNLLAWGEESLKPRPIVGEDGRATGRRFKEAHGWRKTGHDHVTPCHVQHHARRTIEISMMARVQMNDPLHVGGPVHRRRVLRTGNDKFFLGKEAGWLAKNLIDLGLTVRRPCSHITQCALKLRSPGAFVILERIHGAVKRLGRRHSVTDLQCFQSRPAGEAEINIQFRHVLRQQISGAPAQFEFL